MAGPCRNLERGIAEILDGQAQIDAGRLDGAMPEEIADRLDRRALTQEVDCKGMPKAVRTCERNRKASRSHPSRKGGLDRGGPEAADRRAKAQKDFAVRQCGAIRSARPPVAIACASTPSSARIASTIPSTWPAKP